MIRNKLETLLIENNSLMPFVFTRHSYWLQMTYSQAFKKKNTDDLSLHGLNSKVRKKRRWETRVGTIKDSHHAIGSWLYSQGGHRWSPGRRVSMHACMCVILHMPFVLEQRSVCVKQATHNAPNWTIYFVCFCFPFVAFFFFFFKFSLEPCVFLDNLNKQSDSVRSVWLLLKRLLHTRNRHDWAQHLFKWILDTVTKRHEMCFPKGVVLFVFVFLVGGWWGRLNPFLL